MDTATRFKKIMNGVFRLSFKEEVFNCVTHGIMAVIMLILIPICAVYSYAMYDVTRAIGVSIFTICLFLMFMGSTLYHSMKYSSPQKAVFRILDHIFIYFAIAGSYTPIALSLIKGWEGTLILVVQWTMVLIGILYKSLSTNSLPKLSLTIYLVMGWTAVLFIPSLLRNANTTFLTLIVVGGIMYSIGAYFYAKKSMKYSHVIWHVFISLASTCHFIAIVFCM